MNKAATATFLSQKGRGVLEKEKSKPPLTSTSAAVDVGDTFQTKTIACCSTKEKRSEHKMNASNSVTNDEQNERMVMENLIKDKSFEHKADAVAEIHSKITADETNYAKEGHVLVVRLTQIS